MLLGHDELIKQFTKLAKERELGHGYLFFGAPGVGKFSFAHSLANYLENGEFDVAEIAGTRPLSDCKILSPGSERSLGIDAVRGVRQFLSERPNVSPYRTLIIDQAETLTTEAENALLKVTEEPTEFSLLIFAATDPEVLLPTLRSRLHSVYFSTVGEEEIKKFLGERGVAPKEAANFAARAMGRPGLAIKMANDPVFQKVLSDADKFLAAPYSGKRSIIKILTDDESFSLDAFLEALMILAWNDRSGAKTGNKLNPGFWHYIFSLRAETSRFALNPKLQLTALAQSLE